VQVRKAAELGVLGVNKEDVKVDFSAVMQRMRKLRADISHNDSARRFASELEVDVYQVSCLFMLLIQTAKPYRPACSWDVLCYINLRLTSSDVIQRQTPA